MSELSLIEAAHVRKRFGAVQALADATLEVRSGEIHCLIGENGAGKTTLLRMFAGLVRPDGGELRLRGEVFAPATPRKASDAGVRVLGQEFPLAPNVTVMENLVLGSAAFQRTCRGGRFPWARAEAWAAEQLERHGVRVAPRTPVDRLTVSERQLVALVRCTLDDPAVVFLDEPSSALDGEGLDTLTRVVREMREHAVAIVYVSHKLEEILELGDRITVMRDGTTRATLAGDAATEDELVRLMVGREIGNLFPDRVPRPRVAPTLEVRDLEAPRVHGVSFNAHDGEILGIGGLIGAGRTELAKAIAGLAPRHAGELRLDGEPIDPGSRTAALRLGIEYMTEDRTGEGLVPLASLADNMTARVMGNFKRGPFVDRRAQERFAREQIERFSIATGDARTPVGASHPKIIRRYFNGLIPDARGTALA